MQTSIPSGSSIRSGPVRSLTRSETCLKAPRSRGPPSSASKRVSLPWRASLPTSVKFSWRSMTCIPSRATASSAIASRSVTQNATWSSVRAVTRPRIPADLRATVDRALQLSLAHARAARDVEPARLPVQLLLRAGLALPRAGLVDGARGDLLRALRRAPLLLLAREDVLVLALAL